MPPRSNEAKIAAIEATLIAVHEALARQSVIGSGPSASLHEMKSGAGEIRAVIRHMSTMVERLEAASIAHSQTHQQILLDEAMTRSDLATLQIGRASCRERV